MTVPVRPTLTLAARVEKIPEELWGYFDLKKDPFNFVVSDTVAFTRCLAAIKRERGAGELLCIEGEPGSGKGTLVRLLGADAELDLIRADTIDQRLFTPGALMRTLIWHLRTSGKEGAISSRPEAQYRELARLLYERHLVNKSAGRKLVLVMDDGQQWSVNSIRALKRVREIEYMGRTNFLEVVVLAHSYGVTRIRQIEEVGRRFTYVALDGFTQGELAKYVTRALGHLFASDAVIAEWCRHCFDRRPLTVQNLLKLTLWRVMQRGGERIELEDIETGLSLPDAIGLAGIKLDEIAAAAGVSRSTVSAVLNNKYTGIPATADKVNSAARQILTERLP